VFFFFFSLKTDFRLCIVGQIVKRTEHRQEKTITATTEIKLIVIGVGMDGVCPRKKFEKDKKSKKTGLEESPVIIKHDWKRKQGGSMGLTE
jgi:hypothetical protein